MIDEYVYVKILPVFCNPFSHSLSYALKALAKHSSSFLIWFLYSELFLIT